MFHRVVEEVRLKQSWIDRHQVNCATPVAVRPGEPIGDPLRYRCRVRARAELLRAGSRAIGRRGGFRAAECSSRAMRIDPMVALRFDSVIRMPEEIKSVVLGRPGILQGGTQRGGAQICLCRATTRDPVIATLMIATKSGTHVTLELISDGAAVGSSSHAIDFMIEYCAPTGSWSPPLHGGTRPPSSGRSAVPERCINPYASPLYSPFICLESKSASKCTFRI